MPLGGSVRDAQSLAGFFQLKHDLYYNEIRFSEYYDKIAANYAHKLPLIFKKWDTLKGILGSYCAYNFDIIIDKDVRLNDPNKVSIISGGSKELKDSIREIVLHTRKQFHDFAGAGVVSWLQYIGGPKPIYQVPKIDSGHYLMKNDIYKQNGPNMQNVDIVKKKVDEILILLNPIEDGFSKSSTLDPELTMEILYKHEVMFKEEINALYYFNLYYDYGYHDITSNPVSATNGNKQFPISARPKDCLMSILRNDEEIDEWFNRWMQDICDLQKQVYEATRLQSARANHTIAIEK